MKINREYLVNKLNEVKDQRFNFGENEDIDIEEVNNLETRDIILLRDEVDNLSADIRLLKRYLDDRIRGRLEGKAFRLVTEYSEVGTKQKWFHMILIKLLNG